MDAGAFLAPRGGVHADTGVGMASSAPVASGALAVASGAFAAVSDADTGVAVAAGSIVDAGAALAASFLPVFDLVFLDLVIGTCEVA
jgi:hypothetical protein